MKKFVKYMLLSLLVWGGTACSKDPDAGAAGEGAVRFDIRMAQPTRAEAMPPEVLIRIYRADGALIRRYNSVAEMPSPLYLVAGDYKIRIEAGDPAANAAFIPATDAERLRKLYFAAEEPFTLTAHKTLTKEIKVPVQNVGATICFDPEAEGSENGRLSGVAIDVAAMTLADAGSATSEAYEAAAADAPKLTFGTQKEQTGYFICPEGVASLVWRFRATHAEAGEVLKIGSIDHVEAGKCYKMTFTYSPLPDGEIGITVSVSEDTEISNDQIIFKPQPELTADEGFDLEAPAPYREGSTVGFTCMGIVDLGAIDLDGAALYTNGAVADPLPAGVTVDAKSGTEVAIALGPDWFATRGAGLGSAVFRVDDSYDFTYHYAKQGLVAATAADCDLWANTARLKAIVTDETAADVKIRYRREGSAEWAEAAAAKGADGFTWTAATAAAWNEGTNANGLTVYTPDKDHSIFADNTYEYQLVIGGTPVGEAARFTPTADQSIPNGDMSNWSTKNVEKEGATTTTPVAYPNATADIAWWGCGNNTAKKELCTQSTYSGMEGSCAKLAADGVNLGIIKALAAGNLFTGSFKMNGSTGGNVYFGVPYTWKTRPTKLLVKHHTTVGTVDYNKHNGPLAEGTTDIACIYVAIVDWSAPHVVGSSTSGYSGVWDCAAQTSVDEGKIIGYGKLEIKESSTGTTVEEVDIPIQYYDTTTKPRGNYTLVIACATSMYGDYFNGCSTNVMYVDDFRWGY